MITTLVLIFLIVASQSITLGGGRWKFAGVGYLRLSFDEQQKDSLLIYSQPSLSNSLIDRLYHTPTADHSDSFWEEINKEFTLQSEKHWRCTNSALFHICYVMPWSIDFPVTEYKNGWCKILYDQPNGKTGWIRLTKKMTYERWEKRLPGYFITESAFENKKTYIHKSYDDKSSLVDSLESRTFPIIRIKGDWALVGPSDTEIAETPRYAVGWVRWRDTKGYFLLSYNYCGC